MRVLSPAWYKIAEKLFRPLKKHILRQTADGACFFHAVANFLGGGLTADDL
jgi:hypothetical protein